MTPNDASPRARPAPAPPDAPPPATRSLLPRVTGAPACPKCGGKMWDNRATKRNPKAPDFRCRDRTCGGVLWPGQHSVAVPILTPRAQLPPTPAPPWEEAGQGSQAAAEAGTTRADERVAAPSPRTRRAVAADARIESLRDCYLDVTEFVLSEVRPKYRAAGVPCSDATVAAIAATLFIRTCRGPAGAPDREGV